MPILENVFNNIDGFRVKKVILENFYDSVLKVY